MTMATKKGDGKRTQKVADEVRSELMNLLLTGAVHDPMLTQLSVSAVLMTDDLRLAKVYVRSLEVDPNAQTQKAVLRGLERAKGFLRREVAQRLSLRYAPDLRFHWDESIDRGRHMEALLQEIKSSEREPDE
jgi:ribosome-binding factor A